MLNHAVVFGVVAAVVLPSLVGCDEYGPFEPTEVTYYSYETFDPHLGSECGWLTDSMGCAGADCTIVGTEGEMEVGLNDDGDEIRVDMRGIDSPEWITMYGPVEGNGFSANYTEEESMDGVESSATVELSGDSTEGEIQGDMVVDVAISAYGQDYDCSIEVKYEAVPAGEAGQEMTLGGGPRSRTGGIDEAPVLAILRVR